MRFIRITFVFLFFLIKQLFSSSRKKIDIRILEYLYIYNKHIKVYIYDCNSRLQYHKPFIFKSHNLFWVINTGKNRGQSTVYYQLNLLNRLFYYV